MSNETTAYIATIVNDISTALSISADREELVTVRLVDGELAAALEEIDGAWEMGQFALDWQVDEYTLDAHATQPNSYEIWMGGPDAEARIILTTER